MLQIVVHLIYVSLDFIYSLYSTCLLLSFFPLLFVKGRRDLDHIKFCCQHWVDLILSSNQN